MAGIVTSSMAGIDSLGRKSKKFLRGYYVRIDRQGRFKLMLISGGIIAMMHPLLIVIPVPPASDREVLAALNNLHFKRVACNNINTTPLYQLREDCRKNLFIGDADKHSGFNGIKILCNFSGHTERSQLNFGRLPIPANPLD